MTFDSNVFLYLLFPLLFAVYFISGLIHKKKAIVIRNSVLCVFSLLFYYFSSGHTIIGLILLSLLNYGVGLLIYRANKKSAEKMARIILSFGCIVDILVLVFYKYTGFFIANVDAILNKMGKPATGIVINYLLPIGISFYTFSFISYLVDVYRKDVEAQQNFFKWLLYVSFFPKLIAGPIVRYKSIAGEIDNRDFNTNNIYEGIQRFIIGLSKKVLLANLFGKSVDQIFLLPSANLSTPLAWAGLFLYTLQIYYDFSAYSDMAIGIARVFGFHFEENFKLPYSSENITVFWRGWHISLSSCLRDYLYIPLGGNRKGTYRTYLNLCIVFLVCGVWHGAAWTFVLWGLYHGIFSLIERFLKNKFNFTMRGIWGTCITFFIVMMGWLLFRAESIEVAGTFLRAMMGKPALSGYQYFTFSYYVPLKTCIYAGIGLAASMFSFTKIRTTLNEKIPVVKNVLLVVLLFLDMAYMADASFTPFIYAQF